MTEGPTVASDPKSGDSFKPDANSEIGEITDKLRGIIVVGIAIACLWGLGITLYLVGWVGMLPLGMYKVPTDIRRGFTPFLLT